jgi:hypothetical protein
MIKQALFCLLLVLPLAGLAKDKPASKAPAFLSTAATLTPAFKASPDGVRAPFANEEAKYYNKAWPIKETHSLWALILMGSVLAIIFTLLIHKMARSKPRQPEE